jgi:hypothetical protein
MVNRGDPSFESNSKYLTPMKVDIFRNNQDIHIDIDLPMSSQKQNIIWACHRYIIISILNKVLGYSSVLLHTPSVSTRICFLRKPKIYTSM